MLIPSIRQRRIRVNHERMLEFVSTDSNYLSASFSNDFGTGDWAISFVMNTTSIQEDLFELFATNTLIRFEFPFPDSAEIRYKPTNGTVQTENETSFPSQDHLFRLIHFIVQRSGTSLEWYINGEYRVATSAFLVTDTFDFSAATLHIGANQTLSRYYQGLLGNLIIFDTALTSDQAASLFVKTGVVPSAIRANVLGHWPLSQLSYATLQAWDSVEQYNTDKSTIVTANHATLNNYTNASVGQDDTANQTRIHNVYSKSVQSDLGLSENRLRQSSDYLANLPSSSSFTFGCKVAFFDIQAAGVSNYIMVACGARNQMLVRTGAGNELRELIINNVVLGPGATVLSVSQDMGVDFNNKHNIFLISFDSVTGDVIFGTKANDQIKVISSPATGYQWAWVATGGRNINLRGGPFTNSAAIFDMKSVLSEAAVWTTNLSSTQMEDVLEQEDFSLFSPNTSYFVSDDDDQATINERNGLTAFNLVNAQTGADYSGVYLTKRSGLPRIKEGLSLNGTSEYFELTNFNPTNENGYTFSFVFALDSNRVFDIDASDVFFSNRGDGTSLFLIRGTGNSKQLNIFGFFGGLTIAENVSLAANDIDLSDINQIDVVIENRSPGHVISTYLNGNLLRTFSGAAVVNLAEIPGSYFIGRDDGQARYLQGTLFSFRISKSVKTADEISRTYNNSILEYYFEKTSADQLIMSFNSAYFSENGTNVQAMNFADVFPTINALGFTGATTAAQLADLQASIITLDSIR